MFQFYAEGKLIRVCIYLCLRVCVSVYTHAYILVCVCTLMCVYHRYKESDLSLYRWCIPIIV